MEKQNGQAVKSAKLNRKVRGILKDVARKMPAFDVPYPVMQVVEDESGKKTELPMFVHDDKGNDMPVMDWQHISQEQHYAVLLTAYRTQGDVGVSKYVLAIYKNLELLRGDFPEKYEHIPVTDIEALELKHAELL